MTSPTAKLRELEIDLPTLPVPGGKYVHAVRTGRLLFLAGKGTGPYTGKVGREVSLEQAYEYSRQTAITLLSVIVRELGSLDEVTRIVKVFGLVNAVPEFTDHPKVVNGCSDLLIEVFGERGRHARTAVGAGSTPHQIPVEIEMIVECSTESSAP
jgi:enamine deaminase RidA (YjgF/YER057c/UK114 family)